MAEDKQYTLEELKAKLTDKQRIFCHEYIVDWNKTRAAKAAGYSEDMAYSIGWENTKKPELIQYINFIKNNLEEESGITKLRNLKELAKIAYSSISHLHENWIELSDWEQIKADNPGCLEAVKSIDTKTEKKSYQTEGGGESEVEIKYIKVELHSKTEAMKMINEMMGYKSAEKIDVSGTIKTVNLDALTTEELLLRAKAAKELTKKE
jgi:phage terminase small subunit